MLYTQFNYHLPPHCTNVAHSANQPHAHQDMTNGYTMHVLSITDMMHVLSITDISDMMHVVSITDISDMMHVVSITDISDTMYIVTYSLLYSCYVCFQYLLFMFIKISFNLCSSVCGL